MPQRQETSYRIRLVAATTVSMAVVPLAAAALPFAYAQDHFDDGVVPIEEQQPVVITDDDPMSFLSVTKGFDNTTHLHVAQDSIAPPVANEPEPQPEKETTNNTENENETKNEEPRTPISVTVTYEDGYIEPIEDPGAYDPEYEFHPTSESDVDYSWVTGHTFDGMSKSEKIQLIGEMAREDYRKTGILASVTAAQFICESGVMSGGSDLADDHNNFFGIKASSDGFNWRDSTWTGRVVNMKTQEEYTPGVVTDITSLFRAYDNVWDSVRDHSAYLTWMTKNNGAELRYKGIVGCTDPKEAIHIIKTGGYATSSTYESTILKIIDNYGLRQYDEL